MTKPTLKQLQLENDELRKIIKEMKTSKNEENQSAEIKPEEIIPVETQPAEIKDLPYSGVAPIKIKTETGHVFKIVLFKFNLDGDFEISIPDEIQPNMHLCYDKYLRESVLKILPNNGVIV